MKSELNIFQKHYLNTSKTLKKVQDIKNREIYLYYYNSFLEDVLSIFTWKNIPKYIPTYVFEWCLLTRGQLCLYKEDDIYKVSSFVTNLYDEYGQPVYIQVYPIFSNNIGFEYEGKFYDEFEYCYDNKIRNSFINTVIFFSEMVSEIEITLNLCEMQLRQPFLFKGDKKTKKSIDDLMNKICKGTIQYCVESRDFVDNGGLELIELDTHGNLNKRIEVLYQLKEKYIQEYYRKIGLHINLQNKKERLTENESVGYNELGNISISGRLELRKEFCERVKNHFGLNIDVEFSKLIRESEVDLIGNNRNNFEI